MERLCYNAQGHCLPTCTENCTLHLHFNSVPCTRTWDFAPWTWHICTDLAFLTMTWLINTFRSVWLCLSRVVILFINSSSLTNYYYYYFHDCILPLLLKRPYNCYYFGQLNLPTEINKGFIINIHEFLVSSIWKAKLAMALCEAPRKARQVGETATTAAGSHSSQCGPKEISWSRQSHNRPSPESNKSTKQSDPYTISCWTSNTLSY